MVSGTKILEVDPLGWGLCGLEFFLQFVPMVLDRIGIWGVTLEATLAFLWNLNLMGWTVVDPVTGLLGYSW